MKGALRLLLELWQCEQQAQQGTVSARAWGQLSILLMPHLDVGGWEFISRRRDS